MSTWRKVHGVWDRCGLLEIWVWDCRGSEEWDQRVRWVFGSDTEALEKDFEGLLPAYITYTVTCCM